jgi:hypothetical protein
MGFQQSLRRQEFCKRPLWDAVRGAIDLAMYLEELSFVDAVKCLRQRIRSHG